jgi:peroxiredoxin/Tfp pilus assembly protein PilF
MKNQKRSSLTVTAVLLAAGIASTTSPLFGQAAAKHEWTSPAVEETAVVRHAVDLAGRDKPAQAVELLQQAVSHDPYLFAAHIEIVRIRTFYLGQYQAVRTEYEDLIKREPQNGLYPVAFIIGAENMLPEDVKHTWLEKAAASSPGLPWGHYAQARLIKEQDPQAASGELRACIRQEETLLEPYQLLLSIQKDKLHNLDDAETTAAKMVSHPETKSAGLLETWGIHLAKAKSPAEGRAALAAELDRLAASAQDLETLTAARIAYLTLLSDWNSAVLDRIHQIDPAWYDQRGSTFVLATFDGNGSPRQLPISGHAVGEVFAAYFVRDDLNPAQKVAGLEPLLAAAASPDAQWYILQRLLTASEQLKDSARVLKYAEALHRMDPDGVTWLAQVAMASADAKRDLQQALSDARRAQSIIEQGLPLRRTDNTDPDWFRETASDQWRQQNYKEKDALVRDSYGWVLTRLGKASEAEPMLRKSLEDSRSDDKLLHLAEALRGLNRPQEAEQIAREAQSGYASVVKAKMLNEPAPQFQLNDLTGAAVSLSDFQGKVVLLYFFSPVCGACIKEEPYFAELGDRYKDRGLEILAISLDGQSEKSGASRYAANAHGAFRVLLDNQVASLYSIPGMPVSTVLIDKQGRLRYRLADFTESTPSEFDIVINELLK